VGISAVTGAAQGIQASMRAFDRSSSAVSKGAAQLSSDQPSSGSDIVDGMVGMGLDAAGVKANVAVFRAADEMLGTLLDMKA
jgi:hypothetical protein